MNFLKRGIMLIRRLWLNFLLNNNLLIIVDNRHRGVGKTTMMIKRAIKEDIPIVVNNKTQAHLLKNMARHIESKYDNHIDVIDISNAVSVQGKTFPNGVMIDESVNVIILPELKSMNIRIRGGFIANYNNFKEC